MKHSSAIISFIAVLTFCINASAGNGLRLIYWNIQNGMWDGQPDNYDRFVSWVKSYDPDICVWCEAQSLYVSGTERSLPQGKAYLPEHWDDLAARYGHSYVYIGGHRDGYPQAITSKYPIENVSRIIGNQADTVILHGAGWARIRVHGRTLNIVPLHLAPHQWAPGTRGEAARKESAARREGDRYRRMEIQYICEHTISSGREGDKRNVSDEYWMMMGDFNSRSRADNGFYKYADDDTKLLVHDYILQNTPYKDVIACRYPGQLHPTMHYPCRLDYVYLTPALYDKVTDAYICHDFYTEPVRNPDNISNFYHPSDHRPIIVDFKFQRRPGMAETVSDGRR